MSYEEPRPGSQGYDWSHDWSKSGLSQESQSRLPEASPQQPTGLGFDRRVWEEDRLFRQRQEYAYWEWRRQQDLQEQQRRSRHNDRAQGGVLAWISRLMWFSTSTMTLLVILMFASAWQSSSQWLGNLIQEWSAPPPSPRVDVKSIVITQVREASELTTAVFTMEAIVPTSRDNKVGSFIVGTTRLLYIAYGEVRAGVDLRQITPDQVEVLEDDTIRLRLPPPRILDSKLDVNRSNVYDYDRGILGLGPDIAPQLQTLAQQQALQKITAAACAANLLTQANQRAQQVVSQILTLSGYRRVIVEIQPPNTAACPADVGVAPLPALPTVGQPQ